MLLLTAQGTPCLLAGDEFYNSQKGNNNAYFQDNPVGWVNWSQWKEDDPLYLYVQQLIRFRKEHACLHQKEELRGIDRTSCGMPDVSYHGENAWQAKAEVASCQLGVAALVIQKYGLNERGFTPDRLKEILFKSAYDVDNYNPKYAGQLGYGCVDATAALGIEVTDEMPTLTLKNNKVSDGNLLFWVNYQLAGNARIIIYNSTGGKVFDSKRGVMAMSITTIDVSKLAAGYYTMEYQCNGRTMKQNFIKY